MGKFSEFIAGFLLAKADKSDISDFDKIRKDYNDVIEKSNEQMKKIDVVMKGSKKFRKQGITLHDIIQFGLDPNSFSNDDRESISKFIKYKKGDK
jgi:hypothetical protein